jgi:hypothetical protein
MKTLTLDYGAIQRDAVSLLRAYDIPLKDFAENLLTNPESLLSHREVRMEHLESVLAQHVPQGRDYYALTSDADLLDRALIPWRNTVDRIMDLEGIATESVSLTVERHIGDAVVVAVRHLDA